MGSRLKKTAECHSISEIMKTQIEKQLQKTSSSSSVVSKIVFASGGGGQLVTVAGGGTCCWVTGPTATLSRSRRQIPIRVLAQDLDQGTRQLGGVRFGSCGRHVGWVLVGCPSDVAGTGHHGKGRWWKDVMRLRCRNPNHAIESDRGSHPRHQEQVREVEGERVAARECGGKDARVERRGVGDCVEDCEVVVIEVAAAK